VFPKTSLNAKDSYLMNRELPAIELHEVLDPAQAVFYAVGKLPGPLEQVAFQQAGGVPEFSRPFSAQYANLTVRQLLNRIAGELGPNYGWTLSGAKNFRIVRFHAALPVPPPARRSNTDLPQRPGSVVSEKAEPVRARGIHGF